MDHLTRAASSTACRAIATAAAPLAVAFTAVTMILMQSGESTIERALYLARSGQAKTVDEIRRKLKVEGYGNVDAHLSGGTLKNQLRASILNAAGFPRKADPGLLEISASSLGS